MTLPDVLEALAVRLPERVRLRPDPEPGWYMFLVLVEGAWQTVYEVTPTVYGSTGVLSDAMLEYALREECEARGWQWTLKCGEAAGQYTARVYRGAVHQVIAHHGVADTPAEALARAVLLTALEAQP